MSAFLSTLSLRRATSAKSNKAHEKNFYPRSPCGERHRPRYSFAPHFVISIHALLAESDAIYLCKVAPRSDYFYPRSPCGERRSCGGRVTPRSKFLSTLSLRRATIDAGTGFFVLNISIHALLAESDNNGGGVSAVYFISIHALLAESDRRFSSRRPFVGRFLSTLSLRRATAVSSPRRVVSKFLSTLSLRRATAKGSTVGGAREISIHALLAESDNMTPNYIPRMP